MRVDPLRCCARRGRPSQRDDPGASASGRKRPIEHSNGRWQPADLRGPGRSHHHAEWHADDAQRSEARISCHRDHERGPCRRSCRCQILRKKPGTPRKSRAAGGTRVPECRGILTFSLFTIEQIEVEQATAITMSREAISVAIPRLLRHAIEQPDSSVWRTCRSPQTDRSRLRRPLPPSRRDAKMYDGHRGYRGVGSECQLSRFRVSVRARHGARSPISRSGLLRVRDGDACSVRPLCGGILRADR